MGYPIKFQPQLDRGIPVPGGTQGSRDCGPRTVQMGIDGQVNRVVRLPDLRRRMGTPGPQVTNVFDAKRGVESYALRGRKPMDYTIRTVAAEVRGAVSANRFVQICIDYGKWNQIMARTGDPGFDGGHSIGIRGQRHHNGKVQWKIWDPLEDKRRPEIPQGPRWVPREKVMEAAASFARAQGRCYAGVFGGGQPK